MNKSDKKNNNWQQVSSKTVYKNKWISVREDQVIRPNGETGIYGVIDTPLPSVHIIAINDQSEILCIEQIRYPIMQASLELPGGASETLDVLNDAKRELQEETGLIANRWDEAGKFSAVPALLSTWSHVFIARDLQQTNLNKQQEEGIVSMKFYNFSQILTFIKEYKIHNAQAITALVIGLNFLGQIKAPKRPQ